jgi:hypothetical protein
MLLPIAVFLFHTSRLLAILQVIQRASVPLPGEKLPTVGENLDSRIQ